MFRWLKEWRETRRLRREYIAVVRQHFRKLNFIVASESDRQVMLTALDLAAHWLPVIVDATQAGEVLKVYPVNLTAVRPPQRELH
jgi:hypothetical protein